MKKFAVLLFVLSVLASVHAMPGIGFANDTNGYWDYTASAVAGEGAFSFIQPVSITNVENGPADILLGKQVYVPTLNVSGLVSIGYGVYTGVADPSPVTIEIKDGSTVVLTGTLASGAVFTIGTTAVFYDTIDFSDMEITWLNGSYASSAFIGSLQVGSSLDFALSLQRAAGTTIADLILSNQSTGNDSSIRTFSGSMAIPEPATMALLGLGALALLRKRKA